MRWILLVAVTLFVTGCYVPPRRAKACATCSKKASRPASHRTVIR